VFSTSSMRSLCSGGIFSGRISTITGRLSLLSTFPEGELSDSYGFVVVAPALTIGRVCRLQLLLAFARAVNFRSDSRGTRDHILLSQISDFPFRRLLRLARLRWRYSTPPPHGSIPGFHSEDPGSIPGMGTS
jgi:hypothetical protein